MMNSSLFTNDGMKGLRYGFKDLFLLHYVLNLLYTIHIIV